MRPKSFVMLTGVIALASLLALPAEAQPYGYGYGYGPRPTPPPSRWGYRHRVHGYVGGQVMGLGILHQQLDEVGHVGGGGGFGLFGGVRLGPFVGLELNWTYTVHDESWEGDCGGFSCRAVAPDFLQLQTITADFKLHIPTRGIFEPFFQAGAGFGFLGVTGDYEYDGYIFQSGPTFSLGGGGDFWFSPWFTLGLRLLYRGIYFGESNYFRAESNFLNAISFDVNLAIHF